MAHDEETELIDDLIAKLDAMSKRLEALEKTIDKLMRTTGHILDIDIKLQNELSNHNLN